MTSQTPSPEAIRRERSENPKMRERDLAAKLGITEAQLVAAHVGEGVRRIEPRVDDLIMGMAALGEVMALTRNESAVHEKIGVYDKPVAGKHSAMLLGADIDLRLFPGQWAHGFAVEKRDGEEVRRSLQFFDASGEAVHKIHLRPASDVDAYEALVASLLHVDQAQSITVEPAGKDEPGNDNEAGASADELRARWSRMTDVHQFFGLLKALKLGRQQAVRLVGDDYATRLDATSVPAMFDRAVETQVPIMCFVGNRGCIQIHSMGPWLNVLDETFHLHLRVDHIAEVWAVRKPTKDGHVTSVEAYDAGGTMIIQFFGKREEGVAERDTWRTLVEGLPRLSQSAA
jgi:putative hemin transport protein